jgi:hypothetical protein
MKSIYQAVRKTNNMKIAFLAVFAVLTFSGCTKTTIQQVNQVYSALYTVSASSWAQGQDQDGTKYFYATLNIPELTQDIDINGGVAVYLTFDDVTTVTSPTYEALPEVINGVAYGVIHTTGSVTIDLRAADGSSLTSAITSTTSVKVVLMQAQPLD